MYVVESGRRTSLQRMKNVNRINYKLHRLILGPSLANERDQKQSSSEQPLKKKKINFLNSSYYYFLSPLVSVISHLSPVDLELHLTL